MNQAGNFFKTILGGSQEATAKLLAPQTNTILKQYDNAAKVAANIGPRGGGKASALAEGQVGKAGAYGGVLGQVLPGAAEVLAGVGKAQAGVGSGLLGQANDVEGGLLKQQTAMSERNSASFGGLGQGLGKWLAGLLTKGGSGGGSDSGGSTAAPGDLT